MSLLLENNYDSLADNEKALLKKIKQDLLEHKHINFYAINAKTLIDNAQTMTQFYIKEMNKLADKLRVNPTPKTTEFINELTKVLVNLESKNKKLDQLQTDIPEGMLDVKRALYAAINNPLSTSVDEEIAIQKNLANLKKFMSDLNEQYTTIIKKGGVLDAVLIDTTTLYWTKLREYSKTLKHSVIHLNTCVKLTPAGQLALRCFKNSLPNIPSEKIVTNALNQLKKASKGQVSTKTVLKKIGFYTTSSKEACEYLSRLGKLFFHIPHSERMYHFDYDPTSDLGGTGGNCFGESITFIHSLTIGKVNRICPDAGLLNFQIDQTRELKFRKKTLGEGETAVSPRSKYKSLQWVDIKNMLLENPNFNTGDMCGIIFSMNEYTKSKKGFITGHIAVVAKLDTNLSPYKYLVFEKELGAFGVTDDESLAYLMSQQIMPYYEFMNYSKLKLVKYADATPATYELVNQIKPITNKPKLIAAPSKKAEMPMAESSNKVSERPSSNLFFHPLERSERAESKQSLFLSAECPSR